MARTYTAFLARAEDWLRLGLVVKDRGEFLGQRILPAEWIDSMTTPASTNPNYGFQLWRAHPYQARRYYNPALKGLSTAASEPIRAEDMVFFDGVGGQRIYISRERSDCRATGRGAPRLGRLRVAQRRVERPRPGQRSRLSTVRAATRLGISPAGASRARAWRKSAFIASAP